MSKYISRLSLYQIQATGLAIMMVDDERDSHGEQEDGRVDGGRQLEALT
jgi:hypothetical protein